MKLKLEKILDFLVILTVLAVLNFVLVNPALADQYPPRSGTLAWWHFDEGSGCTTSDVSGNANDGTLEPNCDINCPTWVGSMQGLDETLDYDGTDDYVNFGSDPSLKPSTEMTVEAWFKFDNTTTENPIYSNWDGNGANSLVELKLNSDGKLEGHISQSDHTVIGGEFTPVTIETGMWYHVALVADSMGELSLYINGSKVASTYMYDGTFNDDATNDFYTGRTGAGTDYGEGLIDELRILDRPLSQGEIQDDYQEGHKSTVPEFTLLTIGLAFVLAGGIYFWIRKRKQKTT